MAYIATPLELGIKVRKLLGNPKKPVSRKRALVPIIREHTDLSEIPKKGRIVLDYLLAELSSSISKNDYVRMHQVQSRLLLMLADYDERNKITDRYHDRYGNMMIKYSTMH